MKVPLFATVGDLSAWLCDHAVELRVKRVNGRWLVKVVTDDPLTDVTVSGSSLTDALGLAAAGYEAAKLANKLVPGSVSMVTDEITARNKK